MGKCEHIIEKGKRKGQPCGGYTNKTFDNKFYCASHITIHNKEIKKDIVKEIDNEQPKLEIKSLTNGDSLDDVIQYEYKQMTNKDNDNRNGEQNNLNDRIDNLTNRLFYIENQLKYGKKLNIPEFEIFK